MIYQHSNELSKEISLEIDKNVDFINFYKVIQSDDTLTFQVVKYSDLEYQYYQFKKRIYYTLCRKRILEMILGHTDFSNVNIQNNSTDVCVYNNDQLVFKIDIKIFTT